MYYNSDFIHPITGFKTYADTAPKKSKEYKNCKTSVIPKKKKEDPSEILEVGVDKLNGEFIASYRKDHYKKIVIGTFATIEEAREAYQKYLGTKTENYFVKFCLYRNVFYTKVGNSNVWSRKGETEQQFLNRIGR